MPTAPHHPRISAPARLRGPMFALLATAATLAGCTGDAKPETASAGGTEVARAPLSDAQGRDAGFVTLTMHSGMVHGTVAVKGISPGSHGIHIHTTGKCDAPGFTTAGGHLNPDGKKHGSQNPMGPHQGDLPDVIVGADGTGQGSFMANTTLAAMFDADGAAFIVHAGPDDNKTDPSGNSGGRLLCGVFQKTGA